MFAIDHWDSMENQVETGDAQQHGGLALFSEPKMEFPPLVQLYTSVVNMGMENHINHLFK